MSAAFSRYQDDVWIRGDRRIAKRSERNEGIVFGVDDQCRNANAADDGQGTSLRIVIARVGETERRRNEMVIELLDAVNKVQCRCIVESGKKSFLLLDAVLEPAQKILLINPIATQGHVARAGAQ